MSTINLPDGWTLKKFSAIAASITERVDDPSASGVERYVGLEHLDPESTTIRRWGSPSDVEATKLRFYPGDVIYGRRRAYQRKLGVADFDGICSAHALVLRAKPDVCLPEFLPYFLQSDAFHQRALDISVGSLSPTINWKTLAVQEFALPPVDEQHLIVEMLRACDELREKIEKTHLAMLRAEDALTHIPSTPSNRYVLLGTLCDVLVGFPFKSESFVKSGVRLTRCSNVGPMELRWRENDTVFLDSVNLDGYSKYQLAEGDFVLAMDGTFTDEGFKLACVNNSDLPALLVQRVARLRSLGHVLGPDELGVILQSKAFRSWLNQGMTQTTVAHISSKRIESFPVSLDWIESIAATNGRAYSELLEVRTGLKFERDTLLVLRRTLLNQLISRNLPNVY